MSVPYSFSERMKNQERPRIWKTSLPSLNNQKGFSLKNLVSFLSQILLNTQEAICRLLKLNLLQIQELNGIAAFAQCLLFHSHALGDAVKL